jgi:hypothetical protein
MEINNALDMDLRNRMREELDTLKKYEQMFDGMTSEEKYDLREWIANGNSVNSNPFMIYGGNGCLTDFIDAYRSAEDMAANPEDYFGELNGESGTLDENIPF